MDLHTEISNYMSCGPTNVANGSYPVSYHGDKNEGELECEHPQED